MAGRDGIVTNNERSTGSDSTDGMCNDVSFHCPQVAFGTNRFGTGRRLSSRVKRPRSLSICRIRTNRLGLVASGVGLAAWHSPELDLLNPLSPPICPSKTSVMRHVILPGGWESLTIITSLIRRSLFLPLQGTYDPALYPSCGFDQSPGT